MGQGAAAEDRLKVDPLALDAVEDVQDLVEQPELLFELLGPVLEGPEVPGVLERREQGLRVRDLAEDVLPLLDKGDLLAVAGGVRAKGELGALEPVLAIMLWQ